MAAPVLSRAVEAYHKHGVIQSLTNLEATTNGLVALVPTVQPFVADATGEDAATINAIRDVLIAVGLMEAE